MAHRAGCWDTLSLCDGVHAVAARRKQMKMLGRTNGTMCTRRKGGTNQQNLVPPEPPPTIGSDYRNVTSGQQPTRSRQSSAASHAR